MYQILIQKINYQKTYSSTSLREKIIAARMLINVDKPTGKFAVLYFQTEKNSRISMHIWEIILDVIRTTYFVQK
jgi:hypothetical protein